jgi:hypothetical protein
MRGGWSTTDPRSAALLNGIAGRAIELCEGLRLVSGQAAMQILRRCWPPLSREDARNPCRAEPNPFRDEDQDMRVVSKHAEVRPRARLIEVSSMTEGPYRTTCGRIGLEARSRW